MSLKFKGLGVAMITPFDQNKNIDFGSLETMVEHLIQGNVNYIVLLGTTAESVVLSDMEKHELVRFVVEKNKNRVPLVVGMGGNDTRTLVKTIKGFNFSGIDGILSVTPYYNKPTQKGLELHYKAIAAETNLPIILYNVPGRTGTNLSAETTVKLANEVLNIVAIKEASGNLAQQAHIINNRPEDFLVISGDDALALPQMSIGFDGLISVGGNAFPALYSRMIEFAQQDNFKEARKIHLRIVDVIENLFIEGNPAGVKAVLSIMGLAQNEVRLPLAPVSEETFERLKRLTRGLM